MQIFFDNGFEAGKWAGELAKLLRNRKIIPELVPRARVWRATWKQWIQFEPDWLKGPAFMFGKPGIMSQGEALYAGYYVERGLPPDCGRPEYIIGDDWHWHGFDQCLKNDDLRSRLNFMLLNLPENRRCIWIRTDQAQNCLEYEGDHSLLNTREIVQGVPANEWIDVILGVRFSKKECLDLQDGIVLELSTPIIRSHEISSLVIEEMPE
jgi:hypothetical protein